jgi:carbonic anhydrase/acetyltransferase-like protein (isoleucine patch superfamily)
MFALSGKMEATMTDIFLFGTNSLARMMAGWLKSDPRYRLLGVTLNAEYCNTDVFCNQPLIPFEDLVSRGGDFSIINCVCYSEHFSNREIIDKRIKENGIPLTSYIHRNAEVCEDVEYGEGCLFLERATAQSLSKFGKSNVVWGAFIGHDVVVGDYNYFSPGVVCAGHSNIGSNCFVGINAVITNSVKVASNTTVGGLTFVKKHTQEYEILAPAKNISIKPGRPFTFDIAEIGKIGNKDGVQ